MFARLKCNFKRICFFRNVVALRGSGIECLLSFYWRSLEGDQGRRIGSSFSIYTLRSRRLDLCSVLRWDR